MTVLTKPSQLLRKEDVARITVVQTASYDEEIVEHAPACKRAQQPSAVLFVGVLALLVLSAGFLCGAELYAQYMRTAPRKGMRFQGFCSIPMEIGAVQNPEAYDPQFRVIPLRFYQATEEEATTTVANEVANEFANDADMDSLREEFDIGDSVEKISVFNGPNGRMTSFVHDFQNNVSGIVDSQRCFVMGLDRSLVLPPSVFVLSIEGGLSFDISRVRDSMRALLPPMARLAALGSQLDQLDELCRDKPTYMLEKDQAIIRKRSADEKPALAQFTQFAGRHVHDIHIGNMDELLAFEKAQ